MALTGDLSERMAPGPGAFRRYLALLEGLASAPPNASMREIGRRAGLSAATAYRLLNELVELGVVFHDAATGRYGLSYRLTRLADAFDRRDTLRAVALPAMQELRDKTGETVTLVVPVGRERVCILKVESRHPAHFGALVGVPERLDAGAPGKLLVAFLPFPAREDLFSWLSETDDADSVARLRATAIELASRGYYLGRVERAPDFNAIGVPIIGESGVLAALQVVGPASRFPLDEAERALPLVRAAAESIARAVDGP